MRTERYSSRSPPNAASFVVHQYRVVPVHHRISHPPQSPKTQTSAFHQSLRTLCLGPKRSISNTHKLKASKYGKADFSVRQTRP